MSCICGGEGEESNIFFTMGLGGKSQSDKTF